MTFAGIPKPLLNNDEVCDENGALRPGVKVVNKETGEVVAEGVEQKVHKIGLQPGDRGYLGDDFSGDYNDMRDVMMAGTRHKMLEQICTLSARRLILLREHFLQLGAYNKEARGLCLEVVWIVTRVLGGDDQTDKEMEDDVIDVGQFDSDEASESLEPIEEVKEVSEALLEKDEIIARMKKEMVAKYGPDYPDGDFNYGDYGAKYGAECSFIDDEAPWGGNCVNCSA
jgi:hypothetical protein